MVMLDHLSVIVKMIVLHDEELLKIVGGINLTASFLSAIVRGVGLIYEIGQSVGTALRRMRSGKICPV